MQLSDILAKSEDERREPLIDRLRALRTLAGPHRDALLLLPDNTGTRDTVAMHLGAADIEALIFALAKPTLQ